jgi:hypothetical protein
LPSSCSARRIELSVTCAVPHATSAITLLNTNGSGSNSRTWDKTWRMRRHSAAQCGRLEAIQGRTGRECRAHGRPASIDGPEKGRHGLTACRGRGMGSAAAPKGQGRSVEIVANPRLAITDRMNDRLGGMSLRYSSGASRPEAAIG